MASIRKKLSMVLGLNGEGLSSTSKASSLDLSRSSIDSGYHSMIRRGSQDNASQATTFVTSGTESSPERSPKKLHKAISSTFSGAIQAFSNTVRSTTSYIYPTAGEPELPSSEWAECETPKKASRRSSIMSSVRSRKQRFSPRAPGAKIEPSEAPQSPVPVTQENAPALDVNIPNPSFSYETLGKISVSNGSQLLAGVKLPAGPRNLWPRPTRLTVEQASGDDRVEVPHSVVSKIDDPYVEQGDRLQHSLPSIARSSEFALEPPSPKTNKRYMSDEKGYLSEMESNADISESDGLSPTHLKYVAPGSTEARTSLPRRHEDPLESHLHIGSSVSSYEKTIPSHISSSVPSSSGPSKPETLDGTVEQTAPLEHPSRKSNHRTSSHEDGLNALFHLNEDANMCKPGSLCKRQSADVYDADAETLESSMGSRAAWERHRADRERRYMEIVDMAPKTESDDEVEPELELKRSPVRKPVRYAEELVQDTAESGKSESALKHRTGGLRYAVEAIERPAFPISDLAYAVEAIERPSVTTFDPLETVFQQRPMLHLSDTVDQAETLQSFDLPDSSPSRREVSLSPLADLSPSRVELPWSPGFSPTETPAAPKIEPMTKIFTDEELMTFRAVDLEGQSIRRLSSESTNVSADSLPEHQSHTALEDAYEAGPKAGRLFGPTNLSCSPKTTPVGEDVNEAGLGAARISLPMYSPELVQTIPVVDTSNQGDPYGTPRFSPISIATNHSTYRENLKAASILPKQRSRNGIPLEYGRTVSALSDDTDGSCTSTTQSPLCNAPPPFPSLLVRSEPAPRIRNALDILADHGDDKIRFAGHAGINPSLRSSFNCPKEQKNEAGSKASLPTALEGGDLPESHAQATLLEQHEPQSPSPCTMSSIQSRSDDSTPQETFNAAKLPSFVSPSRNASRKVRRKKKKKSSSGLGTSPFADVTIHATNLILEPESSPTKLEFNKNNPIGRTQTSLGGSAGVSPGGVQKPSPNRQSGRKNRRNRDQVSLRKFAEVVGDHVKWSDPDSEPKSSNNDPCGKGHKPATLFATSSPPRMKIPRARVGSSSDEIHENAESAVEHSKSRFEPEFSIKHFDSMGNDLFSYASGKLDCTSYAGHELDSVLQTNPPGHSRHHHDEDLQQDNNMKATHFSSGDETSGKDSESHKDAPCTPGQKKSRKPLSETKKFAVQRELEERSERACSRLADKLRSRAFGDDHVGGDNAAHKEGRPPWRP